MAKLCMCIIIYIILKTVQVNLIAINCYTVFCEKMTIVVLCCYVEAMDCNYIYIRSYVSVIINLNVKLLLYT